MIFRKLVILGAALLVSGCYRYQGTPGIISPDGVVNWNATNPQASIGLKENFAFYAKESAEASADTSKASSMLGSGFLLVRANCDTYFTTMGKDQRGARVARDAIAPIVTVLTGVISLVRFDGGVASANRYLQAVSLGGGLATSGLDIYDTHFLFGAENIHEVRDLTFKALSAHQEGVGKLGDLQFNDAAMHLIDHQVICTPASILALTKEAIATGDVTAVGGANAATNADLQALLEIGGIFNLPGMATADQAGALWWLYRGEPSGSEQDIGERLKGLGSASPFQKDAAGAWVYSALPIATRDKVLAALASLSPQTKAAFDEALRKDPATKMLVTSTPVFSLGSGSGKVGLKVN